MERCVTRSVPESYGGRFVMLRRPKVVGSFRSQASIETVLVACLALIARCHYWDLRLPCNIEDFARESVKTQSQSTEQGIYFSPQSKRLESEVKMLF